jgi:hypothetical protein
MFIPVLLAVSVTAGVLLATSRTQSVAVEGGNSVLEFRQGGLVYTFHIPTGTEALFDLKKDPRSLNNLLPTMRKEGSAIRKLLEKKLRVDSLEDLRDENSPVLKSLRGLGYI